MSGVCGAGGQLLWKENSWRGKVGRFDYNLLWLWPLCLVSAVGILPGVADFLKVP